MVEDYGWVKEERDTFLLCLLCPVQSLGMTCCCLYRIKTGKQMTRLRIPVLNKSAISF